MHGTESMNKNKALDAVSVALGAALIAVCAWISIPTTVPFTMQTFAVFFVLSALGGRRGTASILVYLLLGAAGLPVFSGFSSGIGALLGNTGGYLVGFLFVGLAYWLATGLFGKQLWAEILALGAGLALCYAFGTAWFLLVYSRANGAVGLGTVLGWCVFPFVLPDILKLALALTIARRLAPVLKLR